MTVGYPDYARLSRDGGYIFYGANPAIPQNATLFQGYCGNWPYIDLYTGINVSEPSHYQFYMEYYSDATFTKQIGYRIAIREPGSVTATQYGNLSEWLWFFYFSKDGSSLSASSIGLYGTTGQQEDFKLSSQDTPLMFNNSHIAAGTLATFTTQHIVPGNAQLTFLTGAASWYVQPQYYDYGSDSWQTIGQLNNSQYPNKQFVVDLPMIDAPMRLQVNNGDGVSQNFIFSWLPK